MKKSPYKYLIFLIVFNCTVNIYAHFLVLLPDLDIVTDPSRPGKINAVFTHPMEGGPVMNMSKPVQFGVMLNGKKNDLLNTLKPYKIDKNTTYRTTYTFKAPGDYIFYLQPAPYWEPAEEKMIIHYTKVVVDVCGAEVGWDDMVGFPVEIKPLTRPYSIYVGNIFQGIVMKKGKPVPFAEIEVEYYNCKNKYKPATDSHITQVIKADANGLFSYSVPCSGWWGFAALIDGDQKMKNPQNKMVDVELGALMWIHAYDMVPVSP